MEDTYMYGYINTIKYKYFLISKVDPAPVHRVRAPCLKYFKGVFLENFTS